MPWDGTELWVAQVNIDGSLDEHKFVAGGKEESIFQPQWSPDGMLCFVSDRSLWWNLYQVSEITDKANVDILYSLNTEFGMPQWVFGMSTYAFIEANKILCTFSRNGIWHLATGYQSAIAAFVANRFKIDFTLCETAITYHPLWT